MKNEFMQELDNHLNNVFYNLEEFGIEFEYQAGGVSPGTLLQGIFDSDPSNNPIDNSDGEYIDNRPKLRIREVDLVNGRPNIQTDRFIVDGITYEADEYLLTRTGETVVYLHKLP